MKRNRLISVRNNTGRSKNKMNYRNSFNQREESKIRAAASSRTIEITIQGVESATGKTFPRGRTPSESRDIMNVILKRDYRKRRRR